MGAYRRLWVVEKRRLDGWAPVSVTWDPFLREDAQRQDAQMIADRHEKLEGGSWRVVPYGPVEKRDFE